MSKKIQKLEKETGLWKQRWEKTHQALLEMAADKQARDTEIEALNRKRLLLLDLCKAFQQERTTLIAQLKEKTAESNAAQNETSEDTKSNEQIEKFSKTSEELGKSLSQAQESLMEDIASQEAQIKDQSVKTKEEAPSKPESTKRKDKKRHGVKQKGNENMEAKKETKEKAEKDEIKLKVKVSEETSSSKQETLNDDKVTDKDKEVTEKENKVKIINEDLKSVEAEVSKEDLSKTEDNAKQLNSEEEESNPKKNTQEKTFINDKNENQLPSKVEVQGPSENKTDVNGEVKVEDGTTKEVEQLSENLKNIDLNETEKENHESTSISNSNLENGERVKEIEFKDSENFEIVLEKVETAPIVCEDAVPNQEDVQIKSNSCPISAKKGKVNIFGGINKLTLLEFIIIYQSELCLINHFYFRTQRIKRNEKVRTELPESSSKIQVF